MLLHLTHPKNEEYNPDIKCKIPYYGIGKIHEESFIGKVGKVIVSRSQIPYSIFSYFMASPFIKYSIQIQKKPNGRGIVLGNNNL